MQAQLGRDSGPGAGAAPGLLLNMPSLQSTLQTRQPAARAPQGAQAAQAAQPLAGRSPSLDTWGATAGSPRAVDAQALSGFHSGSWVGIILHISSARAAPMHVRNSLPSPPVLQGPAAALVNPCSRPDITAAHS